MAPDGQMKQQVDHARRLTVEQPGIELLQLRPDAGQAGERGEQGVEHERPHAIIITEFIVMLGLAGHPCFCFVK